LDDRKLAAYDEICGYAEILGTPVTAPFAGSETRRPNPDEITLIDSPALPASDDEVERIRVRVEKWKPNYRMAVFSASMRSADAVDIARRMESLDPTHLVMTMLDLTGRLGAPFVVAQQRGLKVALTTDSPSGIGALRTPDPDRIARTMLREEVPVD
jgi:flagellar biosynthesis GTPase FlhF